ncbi:MAG: hypothetical protein QGH60_20340 [Phycisphaerae bacterium]|jgi:hypothetical protein|nr:hypothetical protein [Phycisphaerae bacterium]
MKPANVLLIVAIAVVVLAGGFWVLQLYLGPPPLTHGISVVFEFNRPSDDIRRLEGRLAELNERMFRVTNEEEKQGLIDSAERIKADLESAREAAKSEESLAREMVRILKERIDPDGHYRLEWRPVSTNRFEVRMPPPDPKTMEAEDAYLQAIAKIENRNVGRTNIRRLKKGVTTVEKLAADDKKLAGLLGDLLTAHKKLEQKRNAGETKIQQYISDWEVAETSVLKHNIDLDTLRSILSGYVRPADVAKVKNQPKALASMRDKQELYTRAIGTFLEKHKDNTDRTAAIKEVIELYKVWADLRGELDNADDLERLIANAGALEFRVAPVSAGNAYDGQEPLPDSERDKYVKILRDTLDKEGPQGLARRTDRYLWFPIRADRKSGFAATVTVDYGGQRYLLLSNFKGKTLLHQRYSGGWALTNAYMAQDDKGMPAVGFKMNEAGAKLLHTLTLHNKGEHMAILLDNKVYSAPVIQAAISSNGIITMGTFSMEEVKGMINILRAGVLPARIRPGPVFVTPFGPPPPGAEKGSQSGGY